MKKALVGYTGFVGGNIRNAADFDGLYNSKNIADAFGTSPDLLIYCGVRAEKYLANNDPQGDLEQVMGALENIKKINPQKTVLISTIDVFKTPVGVDETDDADCEGLHPYGANRLLLEKRVRELCPDALIIRLPGLFGVGIKKNFIYDYLTRIPSMLKADVFSDLASKQPILNSHYAPQDNGFYKLRPITADQREKLKAAFDSLGFSSLNFTDSRSVYQFYPLHRLWRDINTALAAGLTLWHPATEPVSAGEIFEHLTGNTFVNELSASPAYYNYKTVHYSLFDGNNGYIMSKRQVLREIADFVSGCNPF